MKKTIRLVAFILAVITITHLPVSALASSRGNTPGNAQIHSNVSSDFFNGNGMPMTADIAYNALQSMGLTSGGGSPSSEAEYAVSLIIEIKEWERSLQVKANVFSLGSDTPGGVLVVTLYENVDGIPKMYDLFTADIQSGVLADTPDIPEATGVLSFADANPEKLVISAVICRSLDNPLPLSASVNYDVNGFIVVPASVSTLAATDVTKTSAVLRGKVLAETGSTLNAADFGFVVFNLRDGEVQEELDEDGNPIGVILPSVQPAVTITSDGCFSLPLTNLEQGVELQYMAVSRETIPVYGEPMSVTILTDVPAVETYASPTLDSQYGTAMLKGMITDTKGFDIIKSGMMFGTDPNSAPKEDTSNQSGLGGGEITSYLGALQPGETYYYRAYAENSAGIGYGKTLSFTMPAISPTIKEISVAYDPATWKATFTAVDVNDGGGEIIEQGFRYKSESETEWKKSVIDENSSAFTIELEGQNELPIGKYNVEAYITTSVGTATKTTGFDTSYLYDVYASLDKASITVSSATLNGIITPNDSWGCQQRGFEYKATFDNLWLDAGMETGTFCVEQSTVNYSFELQGLKPYTEYEFRAKVYSYAGWTYSPTVTFTTVFSDNTRETAYQMKIDGKTCSDIAEILKNNFGKTVSEACESLKFAGFNAYDIAGALKSAPYNATLNELTAGLKSTGFDACTVAPVLQTHYADVFAYIGGNIIDNIVDTLSSQGYSVDDRVKVLREVYHFDISECSTFFEGDTDVIHSSLIRIYGASAFSAYYWTDYNAISNTSWYIEKLTEILKDNTSLSAAEIAVILKRVYPEITVYQFISAYRTLYPAVSDIGDAIIYGFAATPLTAAREMKTYYSIDDINSWLIDKHGLDAVQMVQLMMELTDTLSTVPSLLKDNFGITSAYDAAKVMYQAGWTEEESVTHSYWRMLKVLKNDFGSTASDLISIMKDLDLSPLTVAQQIKLADWAIFESQSEWISAYKAQGYTASDLAAWCKTTESYADVVQAIIVLKGTTGYSLNEITAALKQVYLLDAENARTTLKTSSFTYGGYNWWTETEATAAVDLAYDINTLETVIAEMKTGGATAVQIAGTLKETFAVTEPDDVADYLIGLNYEMNEVLSALAQSFRTLKSTEIIPMLSQIIKDKFSQEPMYNMETILGLYESVKGNLNHAVNGVILLHNSGYSLADIARVLKNDVDALHNTDATLSAFEAGQLLLGLKAYGLTYDKLAVFAAIENVYGVNFMLETVIDFKVNQQYSAKTVIDLLYENYGVNTPSAAALCLKTAGYTMTEVLDGLALKYHDEKTINKIEILGKVLEDIYPEAQTPIKVIMEAINVTNPGLASETLFSAGYTMTDIINVLKSEYGLSSGQATELLYDRHFEEVVVSVQDVYGGNGYLDFVIYRKNQGDGLSQLFTWLNEKFAIKDLSQIMNILKLTGFTSDEVIALLYGQRQIANDESVLLIQDAFGTDSITAFLVSRRSQGDKIETVFHWMQKFGIKKIEDITSNLYAAGYTDNELIEFLFSTAMQSKVTIDAESTFGKGGIVVFLKDKKDSGSGIDYIYNWLCNQFAITDLTQIVNYLKAVGYTSGAIMAFLYGLINIPARYGEILSAVQASSGGTDVIVEFLIEKKSQNETIANLYMWLKNKFNVTDMTQTVAYLKAAGYRSVEIMEFLFLRINDPTRNEEILSAVQASSGGSDTIAEFLKEKKNQGGTIANLYILLNERFNVTDMTQTVAYLKATGYGSVEIMEFLYLQINDPTRNEEILSAVQASSGGSDAIPAFLKEKKNQGGTIANLYILLKDEFNITDMTQTVAYLKAAGYTNNEVMAFLYLQITDTTLYGEILAAVQVYSGSDAILEFLRYKETEDNWIIRLSYEWLTQKFGITDINKISSYLIALGYNSIEIIEFLYQQSVYSNRYVEIMEAVQASSGGTDTISAFLKEKKNQGGTIANLYILLKDKFNVTDMTQTVAYLKAAGYTNNEVMEFLYSQITDTTLYREIFESVQASSGSDAILEFLRYKETEDNWIIRLSYEWLTQKFGITDIGKISSYLIALGYSSIEIIEFLYQQSVYSNRYVEIMEAVQAANAVKGTDVSFEFLNKKKEDGENISQLYSWLTDKLNITDTETIVSYLKAIGYSDNEIVTFWTEHNGGTSEQYAEVIQTIQAASNTDVVLDFLMAKKTLGNGLDLLYGWMNDEFNISDISKVAFYFTALGYNSSEIIEFLYSKINDASRHEEILAAVQAAQASLGSDVILRFLEDKKNGGSWNIRLSYEWLTDKFGISDINKISSYFTALGYSSGEIIDFLYQQATYSDNYDEIIAAVQAAQASSGSDIILEFLRDKKNEDNWTIVTLHSWLTDKFGISDISKISSYFTALSYSSGEIVDFLYQQDTYSDNYDEIIAAVQAAQASSGSDVILRFLEDKKNGGNWNIRLIHEWLTEKFGINDINKISAYFTALGYSSSEIIDFLYLHINDVTRYEEILAAVRAAQASSDTDTILEFLKEKKNTDKWDIRLIHEWLTEKFGINDINIISAYFTALGYSSGEVLDFLYQQATYSDNYDEIIAAVQAAQASSDTDTILEFLKEKKNTDKWDIRLIYEWLTEKFDIGDINKISVYFTALGYNSIEILMFLYQQINDPSRYEEIMSAVQASQVASGSDTILEFMKYKKTEEKWTIEALYGWLTEQFGINDVNTVATYFTAVGYKSSEIMTILYRQINDSSRYDEILAAIQAAQASLGSDVVLEFLKEKKNTDKWDIRLIHEWLIQKFNITDVKKILSYLKAIGFTSNEVLEYAYTGYGTFNEQLIASSQNDYGDDSIIEFITHRRNQGDTLEMLYNLIQEFDIIEIGQITSYLQAAGISSDEIDAFLNAKELNRKNQVLTLIQNIYGGDVVPDYLVNLKSKGCAVHQSLYILTDTFGIDNLPKNVRYLKNASYTDNEILYAFDFTNDRNAVAVLKVLYPTETLLQIGTRFATAATDDNDSLREYYSTYQQIYCFKQEFPDAKYSEIVLMLRDTGEELSWVVECLVRANIPGEYQSLILSPSEIEDLISILGSHNENDLKMSIHDFTRIMYGLSLTPGYAVQWAQYGCYSVYDIYRMLKMICGTNSPTERREILLTMTNARITLTEIAEVLISEYGGNNATSACHIIMDLMDAKAYLDTAFTAMIEAGISPRYMIIAAYEYWWDRYYMTWSTSEESKYRYDNFHVQYDNPNEEFSLTSIVNKSIDAMEKLPNEKKKDINVVEEVAAGLNRISYYVADLINVYDAMLVATKRMSVDWKTKVPQSDIGLIDDFINLIVSLVSLPGGGETNNVLEKVLVVNALRTAGYTNDEAVALLAAVVGDDYMMNFYMQVMGGYNVADSWKAIMRVDAYRVKLTMTLSWTIAANAYRLDAAYKILKDVKKLYGKLETICKFFIDHDILQTAPNKKSLMFFNGFGETLPNVKVNETTVNSKLSNTKSYGRLSETVPLGLLSTSEISGVALASGENNVVTIRGSVSTGANTELLLLVKKPDVNGVSQKDTLLSSLTDQELKEIIDFFGCVTSTESVESNGTTYNFELQYCSDGRVGEYTSIIGALGVTEAYTDESTLFAMTLAGNVSISGQVKCGESLTANIDGLINAIGPLTYQWYRDGVAIVGASSNTYIPVTDDIGTTLTVKVSADGVNSTGSITASAISVDTTLHELGSWTPSNDGLNHERTCACGEVTDKKPHEWDEGVVTTQPTHFALGVKTHTCTVCSAAKTEDVQKLTDHLYGDWEQYDETQHKRTCACGDTAFANHTWDNGIVTVQPTHFAEGEKTLTCSECNETKTEIVAKLTAHIFGAWEMLDNDQHYRDCDCGERETAAHVWGEGVAIMEATHTEEGWMEFTCTLCVANKVEVTAKTTEHEYGDWYSYDYKSHYRICVCGNIDIAAHEFGRWTPSADGSNHEHTCFCGENEIAEHKWGEGAVTTEATHTTEGVMTYTCTDCGATKTETIPVDTEHHTGGTEIRGAIAPTATLDGYTGDVYCLGCGKKIADGSVILALGCIKGDIDGDGEVTPADISLAIAGRLGSITLTEQQITVADVDGDGELTPTDISLIIAYRLGTVEEFPIPADHGNSSIPLTILAIVKVNVVFA